MPASRRWRPQDLGQAWCPLAVGLRQGDRRRGRDGDRGRDQRAGLISIRRHGGVLSGAVVTWLVLGLVSASAIRFPFPQGPYDSVQAFFNVVHAALLGCEAVICAGIVAPLGYLLVRFGDRARSQAVRAGHGPGRAGHAPATPGSRPGSGSRSDGGALAGRAADRRGRHGEMAVPQGRRRGRPHRGVPGPGHAVGRRSSTPAPDHSAGVRQRPCRGRRQPPGAGGAGPQSSPFATR
jgi:hypothetical protein